MLKLINNSILASEIADYLKKPIIGENIVLYSPANIKSIKNNSFIFINSTKELEGIHFSNVNEILILTDMDLFESKNYSYIKVDNPSVAFVKIIENFFTVSVNHFIHESSIIEEGAKIGKNVLIGSGCYIGANAAIGDNTIIWENTIIKGKTFIGNECIIKSNSTIGSEVFNFVLDGNNWLQYPQIGEIIIEDDVWIGANTTIEKGTIGNTIIKKGVRIDDLVQIGSNCIIGEGSLIAAGSIISRDVEIGTKCWISTNVSIRENLSIHNFAKIGMGSVVISDIPSSSTFVGNPAKELISLERNK